MKLTEMVKGEAYIRIHPVRNSINSIEDWSFTHDIIIFDGISKSGNLLGHYQGSKNIIKSNLPVEITFHKGWRPASILWNGPKTELSNYEGHLIQQSNPILLQPATVCFYKTSGFHAGICSAVVRRGKDIYSNDYMFSPVRLISATQYHLVIEDHGFETILDKRFAKVTDWFLVD